MRTRYVARHAIWHQYRSRYKTALADVVNGTKKTLYRFDEKIFYKTLDILETVTIIKTTKEANYEKRPKRTATSVVRR